MTVSVGKVVGLLALVAVSAASPTPTQVKRAVPDWLSTVPSASAVLAYAKIPVGTAKNGALDRPPAPTDAAVIEGGSLMTVQVINQNGNAISTMPGYDSAISPPPVAGNAGAGVLQQGESANLVVGNGFSGRIALVDAAVGGFVGRESLIEMSFKNYLLDVDVSNVDGFSVPIVCHCSDYSVWTGSSKNLFDYNSCDNYNGRGSCENPTRENARDGPATPFFSPNHFRTGSYTYSTDDYNANTLVGSCATNLVVCCVGETCDPNPAQY